MLLAIDVGNTQTAIGFFDGDRLGSHWRISTRKDRTADEFRLMFHDLLVVAGIARADIEGVALASVVPASTAALRTVGADLATGPVVVVEPGVRTGLALEVDNPREVGADRVVNAVAAAHRYGGPAVVVDFGTATTFDVVGRDGASYLGGVIAPGLEISVDALVSRTAALRRVELVPPDDPIGRSTVSAIQSGIVYGYAGLVDGIMDRLQERTGPETAVVATGGLASTIVPYCRTVEEVDDFLTLDGLRLVFDLNREH